MMERVGASTCWTKSSPHDLWTALGNLVNLVDALDEVGMKGSMSMLPDALAALLHRRGGRLLHLVAHVHHHLRELGDDLGRHAATALGLRSMNESRRVSAAVVDCQNWD